MLSTLIPLSLSIYIYIYIYPRPWAAGSSGGRTRPAIHRIRGMSEGLTLTASGINDYKQFTRIFVLVMFNH